MPLVFHLETLLSDCPGGAPADTLNVILKEGEHGFLAVIMPTAEAIQLPQTKREKLGTKKLRA